jgi:hypothetical protein
MRELLILAIHLRVIFVKCLRTGGVRAVAAESLLLKHQILVPYRSRRRAPHLTMLQLGAVRRGGVGFLPSCSPFVILLRTA